MYDYTPVDTRVATKPKCSIKWLLGLCLVGSVLFFSSLDSEPVLQLKGYIADEVFVTYMDEADMELAPPMEDSYDENSELMNEQHELVGVHHVYDEEKHERE